MKYIISLYLVLSSFLLHAQTQANVRIEDYLVVQSADDLKKMTSQQRAEYIMFVVRSFQIIEASLMRDRLYIPPAENESRFRFNLLEPNEAYAFAPAVIGVTGLARLAQVTAPTVVPLIRSQVTRVAGSLGANPLGRFAKFSKNSPDITDVIPKSVASVAKAGGGSLKRSLVLGSTGATVGSNLLTYATPLNEESNKQRDAISPVALEPIPDNEREGLICIFGGFPQRYQKIGDTIFCPSPRQQINHPTCKRSGYRPSFLCQSFGLSDTEATQSASANLCVPLRNSYGSLDDLTVRCAEKFEKDFLPKVQAVSPEVFLAIQEELRLGIRALEQQKGLHEIGLLTYCQSNNSINQGRQISECSALLGLIDKLKTLTPSHKPTPTNKIVQPVSKKTQGDIQADDQNSMNNPKLTLPKHPSSETKPISSPSPAIAPILPGAAQ